MKTIKCFEITGMRLSGFKCYQEPTQLDFGNPTVVTGGNGRGKTSIADAIAFAITGLPFFGERGIDRLHSEQNPELFVSLQFVDENGQLHELTRTRQKSRMAISYDGYEIRQLDLTDLFGERDVFLSIFNPLYFIEELGDDGKKLLERYLPAISHEEVLSQLSENVRASLENESILSPEVYLKKRREEIRDLEQTVIYLTGQKDLAESQQRDGQKKAAELQARLDALVSQRDALEAKRFEGLDLSDMQETLIELSARYDEMAQDGPDAADTAELDERLKSLHHKLGQRSAEQYVPKYSQPIAETAARVKELGAKYARESALLKGFRPGVVCPTCRRAVTEADFPLVREEIGKSLSAVVADGKAQKEQLDELRALEKKTEDISDKTFYIAVNYQEKAERLNREKVTSISEELLRLEQKLSRLEYCVKKLPSSRAEVIRGLYFERKELKNLALEMHISDRTVQRYRDSAIEELALMYETLQNAGVELRE